MTEPAYHRITAASEFRELERLRSKARHDEAQALYHAQQQGIQQGMQQGIQQGMQQEREKWQTVVADKDARLADRDAQNEQLRKQIATLQAQLGKASE